MSTWDFSEEIHFFSFSKSQPLSYNLIPHTLLHLSCSRHSLPTTNLMMTSGVYLLVLLKKEQTKRSAVKGFVKFNECKGIRCATKHRKTLRKGKTLRVTKVRLLHGTCMWYKTNFNYSSKFCQIGYIYQFSIIDIFL